MKRHIDGRSEGRNSITKAEREEELEVALLYYWMGRLDGLQSTWSS